MPYRSQPGFPEERASFEEATEAGEPSEAGAGAGADGLHTKGQ